jgi:hypothetical protein
MKERQRVKRQSAGVSQPGEGPILEPVVDASQVAQRASAGADAVDAEPAGIEVAVRTTTSRTGDVVHVVATPDTTVSELMDEACTRLEVADHDRYLLVAGGEVLAEGERTLGDIVSETENTDLDMRLVRRPEAGATGSEVGVGRGLALAVSQLLCSRVSGSPHTAEAYC